jgi:hypothetical protein
MRQRKMTMVAMSAAVAALLSHKVGAWGVSDIIAAQDAYHMISEDQANYVNMKTNTEVISTETTSSGGDSGASSGESTD